MIYSMFSDEYIFGEFLRVKGILDGMPRYKTGIHKGVQILREYAGSGGNIIRKEARIFTPKYASMQKKAEEREVYSRMLTQLRFEMTRRRLSIPADFRLEDDKTVYDAHYWEQMKPCSNPREYKTEYYDDYGFNVRSRGEMIIGNALKSLGLEAKYEPGFIQCGARKIIPDYSFPVRIINRCFFVEFLGMADDEGYIEYNYGKTDEYMRCGILPNRDLILICGTKDWLPSQTMVMCIISSFINNAVYGAIERMTNPEIQRKDFDGIGDR